MFIVYLLAVIGVTDCFYYQCKAQDHLNRAAAGSSGPLSAQGCEWYTTCMEPVVSCKSTSAPYALSYGYSLCNGLKERRNRFSTAGESWITDIRNCLVERIDTYLYETINRNESLHEKCYQVRKYSTSMHELCYDEQGLCDLPPEDYIQIFSTIKQGLNDEKWLALRQVYDTIIKCTEGRSERVKRRFTLRPFIKYYGEGSFGVVKLRGILPSPLSDPEEVGKLDNVSRLIFSELSNAQRWTNTSIDWVAFGKKSFDFFDTVGIFWDNALLVGESIDTSYLNTTMQQLAQDIRKMSKNISVIELHEASLCEDVVCEELTEPIIESSLNFTTTTAVSSERVNTQNTSSSQTTTIKSDTLASTTMTAPNTVGTKTTKVTFSTKAIDNSVTSTTSTAIPTGTAATSMRVSSAKSSPTDTKATKTDSTPSATTRSSTTTAGKTTSSTTERRLTSTTPSKATSKYTTTVEVIHDKPSTTVSTKDTPAVTVSSTVSGTTGSQGTVRVVVVGDGSGSEHVKSSTNMFTFVLITAIATTIS